MIVLLLKTALLTLTYWVHFSSCRPIQRELATHLADCLFRFKVRWWVYPRGRRHAP